VEAIFKERRKRVVNRRIEGKVENSRGWIIDMAVRSTRSATVTLKERKMSRRRGGSGMTMTRRIATTPMAVISSLCSIRNFPFGRAKAGVFLSGIV
jgi:hypothetical protein